LAWVLPFDNTCKMILKEWLCCVRILKSTMYAAEVGGIEVLVRAFLPHIGLSEMRQKPNLFVLDLCRLGGIEGLFPATTGCHASCLPAENNYPDVVLWKIG
jgi:hypothetical protein